MKFLNLLLYSAIAGFIIFILNAFLHHSGTTLGIFGFLRYIVYAIVMYYLLFRWVLPAFGVQIIVEKDTRKGSEDAH